MKLGKNRLQQSPFETFEKVSNRSPLHNGDAQHCLRNEGAVMYVSVHSLPPRTQHFISDLSAAGLSRGAQLTRRVAFAMSLSSPASPARLLLHPHDALVAIAIVEAPID